jgi:hypothetical protein
MSTSFIPIYYENQLCGSITVAEFMSQPRYSGRSVATLMSLNKEDLATFYLSHFKLSLDNFPKAMEQKHCELLWNIMLEQWDSSGHRDWEGLAIREIIRVYLTKVKKQVCPRCKTDHCQQDDDYDSRVFWVSNLDGVEVCRACLWKEEE